MNILDDVGTVQSFQNAMREARLRWARSRALEVGLQPDDPQVETLGIAVWEPAFVAGMQYALSLER